MCELWSDGGCVRVDCGLDSGQDWQVNAALDDEESLTRRCAQSGCLLEVKGRRQRLGTLKSVGDDCAN
jgi:hypothetical protein